MRGVLASEWLKLRTVSSTGYAIGAATAMIALGAVWSFYVGGLADERGSVRAAAPEAGFLPLVQVSLAVLGVLAATSEHATGTIRLSLSAVPKRGVLILAKTGVVAALTLAVSLGAILTTYAVSRVIAGDRSLGFNGTAFANDLPGLLASALSVAVLALVGLGLGFATRSTAAGIVSVVSLLFVLPGVVRYLPSPWGQRVSSFMIPDLVPQMAGVRFRSGGAWQDGMLPPWIALLAMLAYAAVAVGVGYWSLKRRDA
ncbi:ABC transporter permease subunit [Nonomuraea sp. NBC_01738]|uniref:ABC transporter permease subunit n=1 Tax=Nonomuraea sp. NBC_01738 TaxID=2976003 RepID=UPI002E12FEAA|nr:ABC transporter permease subunit [Nonomuraea sp. NBC_01738]